MVSLPPVEYVWLHQPVSRIETCLLYGTLLGKVSLTLDAKLFDEVL